MKLHVNSVCKSAYFHLRNIAQIRKYLGPDSCQSIIHALISSRLDYCNSLMYGIPSYLLLKLQQVQNTAARIVSMTSKREHISPVLMKLHWLPVRFRIVDKILLITYKALNGQAPDYICDLISRYAPSRHNLRSSTKNLLHVPKSRLVSCGDRSFTVASPILWNSLSIHIFIRNATSVDSFKEHLKTYLFKQAFAL